MTDASVPASGRTDGAEVTLRLSTDRDDLSLRLRRRLGQLHLANPCSLSGVVADRIQRVRDRRALQRVRETDAIRWDDPAPLVTVRITTYRRADILVERTLPTVLGQSYDRLDVLVVGDCTDDDTEQQLAKVGDPRVRFVNLPYRPLYPADEARRWRVLGYQAANLSLDLADGSWLAPCDDDDELTPDHVERLLQTVRDQRAELVHGNTGIVLGGGVVGVIGRPEVADGHTSHGALLYNSALRFFRYNGEVWRLRRSLDWDLLLRMRDAGVRMAHLDEVVYRYHPAPASAVSWREQALEQRPDLRSRLSGTSG